MLRECIFFETEMIRAGPSCCLLRGFSQISNVTSFVALHVFALLYMSFDEGDGGGGSYIDGITRAPSGLTRGYESESPILGDNNSGPAGVNTSISNGILNFKTN
mgnify:CR=1 FL=1